VRARITANDGGTLQWELTPTGNEPPEDTDQGALVRGWASLTALVGVAESWPSQPAGPVDGAEPADLELHLVPGAELQEVHRVPGGSLAATLVRPGLGDGSF
jgi:hypothetical protein